MKRRGFFKTALGIGGIAVMPQEKEPEVLKKNDLVKQEVIICRVTTASAYDTSYKPFPCYAYSFGIHIDKPCDCLSNFIRKM